MITLHELFQLHELAMEQVRRYTKKRQAFDVLHGRETRHFVGIIGPRGVGKSVLLRQLCQERGDTGLYISLDSVAEMDVFETVRKAVSDYGVRHVFLDEVHFVKTIHQDIKKVYDFLDVQVTFSSSVALAMTQSARDLSRRVRLLRLPAFQYGEYLRFKGQSKCSDLSLDDLIGQSWEPRHLRMGGAFKEYLQGGAMPYALEEPAWAALQRNILKTVLEKDLPSVHPMSIEEIAVCTKMVEFIAKAQVDGISYSSLSKNLGITKYKAEIYVGLLEKAFVLHRIMPCGTNVLQEPKVLMCLPYRQLFTDFWESIGGTREDFTVDCLRAAGFRFHYLKSTRGEKTPDYLVELEKTSPLVVEVGGKGKGREQFKGLKADRKLILADGDEVSPGKIPLFLLGFLSPAWASH